MDILNHAGGSEAEGVAWAWPPLQKDSYFLIIANIEVNSKDKLKLLKWLINVIYEQN